MSDNLSYLCRLCLTTSEFKFSLFTGNILQKVESLTAIKIIEDDNLPKTCCEACVANVYTSYKFQQCIIESDKTLREKSFNNELHIIEQAKQAPDLFEVLDVEGTFDTACVDTVEQVEPKSENLQDTDECDFVEFSYKVEEVGSVSENNDEDSSNMADNYVLKSLLESTGSTEDIKSNFEDLGIEKNMEYIDVDDLGDGLVLASENLAEGNIFSGDHGNDVHNQEYRSFTSPENPENIDLHKFYNKLDIKDINKKILGTNQKRQKSNSEDIISKFENKFAAYREKQKNMQSALVCIDCDVKFESKRLLQRHMMKHKIDKCPFCSITMRSDNLKRHIQIHTDSPEICDICGKIAKNKESLRGHVNYQHKNSGTIKCETCNREFKSNHHYKTHVKKVHLGIRNHQCHICGKKFFANHDLNKHINMTHRGARPYVCQYCKKGFSSPYARKTHIRQHTLETPYRCEICAAGFRQKVSLVTHMKSKHSDDTDETNPEDAID